MLRTLSKNVRHCKRVQLFYYCCEAFRAVSLAGKLPGFSNRKINRNKQFNSRFKIYFRNTIVQGLTPPLGLTLTAIALRQVFF